MEYLLHVTVAVGRARFKPYGRLVCQSAPLDLSSCGHRSSERRHCAMGTRIWVVAAPRGGRHHPGEVAALRDFYGALGGDGWVDSDGWTSRATRAAAAASRGTASPARRTRRRPTRRTSSASRRIEPARRRAAGVAADLPRLRVLGSMTTRWRARLPRRSARCASSRRQVYGNSMSGTIPSCLANCRPRQDRLHAWAPERRIPAACARGSHEADVAVHHRAHRSDSGLLRRGSARPGWLTSRAKRRARSRRPSATRALGLPLLYHNHLTGPIPRCLGNLSQLQ